MARRTSFLSVFLWHQFWQHTGFCISVCYCKGAEDGQDTWSLYWFRCKTAAEHKIKMLVKQVKNGNYFLLQRNTLPGGLFAFSIQFHGFYLKWSFINLSLTLLASLCLINHWMNPSGASATFKKKGLDRAERQLCGSWSNNLQQHKNGKRH